MQISYIYALTQNGYLDEKKIVGPVDVDNPPQKGETIKTIYDELVKFENIPGIKKDGNILFFQNNKLTPFTIDELDKEVRILLGQFYIQVKASGSKYLNEETMNNGKSELVIEKILEQLEKNKIPIPDSNEEFNFEHFQSLQNRIRLLAYQLNALEMSVFASYRTRGFVTCFISGVNTVLAYENIIKEENSNLFRTEHNFKENKEVISYMKGLQAIYAMDEHRLRTKKDMPKSK